MTNEQDKATRNAMLRRGIDAYEDATGDRLPDGDGDDYRIMGLIADAMGSTLQARAERIIEKERLSDLNPDILIAGLMETSRCLGVAQAKNDKAAMAYREDQTEAYRLALGSFCRKNPHK